MNKQNFWLIMTVFLFSIALPSQAQASIFPKTEVNCMATAIFYEAQGEPYQGKLAVGHVILNRMRSGLYPESVCGVVEQKGQFQWVHNTRLRKGRVFSQKRHNQIYQIAQKLYSQHKSGKKADVTQGSLFFSSNGVRPAPRAVKSVKIGRHQFFTLRGVKTRKV